MRTCLYVTSGWGVHDERWIAALETVGYQVRTIRLGIDAHTPTDLQALVTASHESGVPVLAGPLDAVTRHLVDLPLPVVGLSWGFDLHDMRDRSWLSRLSGLIVDSAATVAIAKAAGVPDECITFLPWGVDCDTFTASDPTMDLSAWGVPPSSRVVLSLRAHEDLYRVEDIIEGFALAQQRISKWHLVIGHEGSLTDRLRQRVSDLNVTGHVHFIGRIAEKDLPSLMRASDAYVSASRVDGTSVTLLQAMACRVPVLVSDTPGNLPWVEPGVTGFLFRTEDAEDLGAQLVSLANTPGASLSAITAAAHTKVLAEANWNTNVPRLGQALARASS